MASRFDPSAFIEAEKRETLATIAMSGDACDSLPTEPERLNSAIPEGAEPKQSQLSQESQPLGAENEIWTAGPRLMAALERPPAMKASEWNRLVRMTKWIADDWSAAAVQAGWHPLEFFGCHSDPFAGRLDRDGIVACLFKMTVPAEITAVHPEHVEILASERDILRYRPFGPRGQAYLWEAYGMKGGP